MIFIKKKFTGKRTPVIVRFLPILIVLSCLFLSIGYATVNDVFLNVDGEAVAMIPEGIYVTNISYQNSVEADYINSNINVVNSTILNHKIILSPKTTDSALKYKIEIYNGYDYAWEFKGISFDSQFYDNSDIFVTVGNTIEEGDLVKPHEYISFYVSFSYVDGVTPSELNNVLNAHINYEFVPCAVLMSNSDLMNTDFVNYPMYYTIKNITFESGINEPDNVVESLDIGTNQNGDIMAYVATNDFNSYYYDLYIQSDTQLYGNVDMSAWFNTFPDVDNINGLNLLNTSNVTDMSFMFASTGSNSEAFTLDVSSLDTSNVTNMSYMFYHTGTNSTNFTLNLGDNFDTSKVRNMLRMFESTGEYSSVFTLDLGDKFDTSNVTNMSDMFFNTGLESPNFTLDLGDNFNTKKVKDMTNMFFNTGYNSSVFTLDLGDKFDTSNVTSMRNMFNSTGYSNTEFTLDLGDKFDTNKVTNMTYMFASTGYNSTVFTLDLGDKFDTSQVTNMSYMFYNTGYNSTKLNTEITIKNPNVTSYGSMFEGVATQLGSQIIVKYTSETSDLVDLMIATKSYASNVVKGWNVDVPITFSIDGNTYNAYEGMTWGQWANSPYDTFGMTCPGNVKGCTIKTEEPNSAGLPGYPRTTNSYVYEYTIIEENYSYSVQYIGGPIND